MTQKELFERDYRDICYFIDHVKNIDLRISILKYLGYQIGINVVEAGAKEKDIIIGKRKEKRIQITPKFNYAPVAQCVVWGIETLKKR
jgi:hypothetical protein